MISAFVVDIFARGTPKHNKLVTKTATTTTLFLLPTQKQRIHNNQRQKQKQSYNHPTIYSAIENNNESINSNEFSLKKKRSFARFGGRVRNKNRNSSSTKKILTTTKKDNDSIKDISSNLITNFTKNLIIPAFCLWIISKLLLSGFSTTTNGNFSYYESSIYESRIYDSVTNKVEVTRKQNVKSNIPDLVRDSYTTTTTTVPPPSSSILPMGNTNDNLDPEYKRLIELQEKMLYQIIN